MIANLWPQSKGKMDIGDLGGFSLTGLSKINVILGKNGCGKSFLLKHLETRIFGREGFGKIRYISPERGGLVQYEPAIEHNILSSSRWMEDSRRRNQTNNFRQQSAVLFRRLEAKVLREIEREHTKTGYVPRDFDQTVDQINQLLDRVSIVRDDDAAFRIVDKETEEKAQPDQISSGEAELISLAIEFLAFAKDAERDKINVFLVDEPDVHLHPDLQYRLTRFITAILSTVPVTLILATHSTSLLAGLAEDSLNKNLLNPVHGCPRKSFVAG